MVKRACRDTEVYSLELKVGSHELPAMKVLNGILRTLWVVHVCHGCALLVGEDLHLNRARGS